MYRSYRDLYKVKPEIRVIGRGDEQSIRLPRWASYDALSLSLVALVPGFLVSIALHAVFPFPAIAIDLVLSAVTGVLLSRFPFVGKGAIVWFWDWGSWFWLRSWSQHDGWKRLDTTAPLRWTAEFRAVDQGTAYATPVVGKSRTLTLHRPTLVRVGKHGEWIVMRGRRGALPAGSYRIVDGRVVPDQAPTLKRKGHGF